MSQDAAAGGGHRRNAIPSRAHAASTSSDLRSAMLFGSRSAEGYRPIAVSIRVSIRRWGVFGRESSRSEERA
jgi:hypothetical protein